MRGKVPPQNQALAGKGITPARAGKRLLFRMRSNTAQDHPRACGEKDVSLIFVHSWLASPPRVRGKGANDDCRTAGRGITPARAGKRSLNASARPVIWDHPRACGEKRTVWWVCCYRQGSPPRVRGKVYEAFQERLDYGITPARAGKSRYFLLFII